MHRIFQAFIDRLTESVDAVALRDAMADAAAAFDLICFAYLAMPRGTGAQPKLISTYPSEWTDHYLESRYERLDPVVLRASPRTEPFEWGLGVGPAALTKRQQQFFDEAATFDIRCGFTIPIHDGRGPIAAVTFVADARHPPFRRTVEAHAQVLQLMAMFFHVHARRKLASDRVVDGIALSPREFECLEWSAQGKSAWEIGRILGISRRTAAFHLENAKSKLGVRSICQAVARLSASRPTMH